MGAGPRAVQPMNSRARFFVVSTSACLVLLLLVGAHLGKSASTDEGAYRQFKVFTDVLSRVKSEYVEEPDMKSVTLGALNGLLNRWIRSPATSTPISTSST